MNLMIMKGYLSICLFLLLAVTSVKAQKAQVYKFKYLPAHTYQLTFNNTMYMSLIPVGDTLKNKTLSFLRSNDEIKQQITTENLAPNGDLPISIKYISHSGHVNNMGKEYDPDHSRDIGTTLLINWRADGKPDSASAKTTVNKYQAQAFISTLNMVPALIKFPERPLKKGDSFSYEVPMDVPAAGMGTLLKATVTMKLTDIKGELAFFDVDQTVKFGSTKIMDIKMDVSGTATGKGKLIYNRVKNFAERYTRNMEMKYRTSILEAVFDQEYRVSYDIKTELRKN